MNRYEFLTGLGALVFGVFQVRPRRSTDGSWADAPPANSLDILVGWLKQAKRVDIWIGDPTGTGQVIFYEKDAIKRALDELETLQRGGKKK